MSQERLDKTTRLMIGTRDAVHVPIAVAEVSREYCSQNKIWTLNPGTYVKFVNDEFTKFEPCDKSEAHGVLNPFLDEISTYEPVIVLLNPGITTPVRHHFDIDLQQKARELSFLEIELEEVKEKDPDCAGCWVIRNNSIIRN